MCQREAFGTCTGAAEGDAAANVNLNVHGYTEAVTACAQDGKQDEALELSEEMPALEIISTLNTYNAAITEYGNDRRWKEAPNQLRKMSKAGPTPDQAIYAAAMAAYDFAKQQQHADEREGKVVAFATIGRGALAQRKLMVLGHDVRAFVSVECSNKQWHAVLTLFPLKCKMLQ